LAEGAVALTPGPRSTTEHDAETVLGRFADITYAYRFGPPAHDLVVVRLTDERDGALLAQTTYEPFGPKASTIPAAELGLRARLEGDDAAGDPADLRVRCRSGRVAHDVRLRVPGFRADDEAFTLAPGETRTVTLRPARTGAAFRGGTVTAREAGGCVLIRGPA
jgi:beta-mannosidase